MSNTPNSFQQGEHPAFDPSRLREATGGEPEFVKEIIELYIADFTERTARLSKHLATLDFDAAHNELHTLKGSSGAIGAKQLEWMFEATLESLREGQFAQSQDLVQQLPTAFQHFLNHIQLIQQCGYAL